MSVRVKSTVDEDIHEQSHEANDVRGTFDNESKKIRHHKDKSVTREWWKVAQRRDAMGIRRNDG